MGKYLFEKLEKIGASNVSVVAKAMKFKS